MKKFITTVLIIIILIIAAIAAAAFSYAKSDDYKNAQFPANTTINGIDCSELTYEEASDKLTDEWNKKKIVVTGQLNDDIAAFTDFGCTYDINDALKEIKRENLFFAAANHFINTPLVLQLPMVVDEYSEDFKERVVTSPFLNSEDDTVTKDAYVDTTRDDFPIIPEVYGTKPDSEKFFSDILQHIQTGEVKFLFDPKDYYTLPKVTADDESLKEYQAYCRKYLSQKITYELGEETFTLSIEELKSLIKDDMSGEADEDAVKNYVAGMASKYNNVGIERNFTSLSGKNIYVYGGNYGWIIDQEE